MPNRTLKISLGLLLLTGCKDDGLSSEPSQGRDTFEDASMGDAATNDGDARADGSDGGEDGSRDDSGAIKDAGSDGRPPTEAHCAPGTFVTAEDFDTRKLPNHARPCYDAEWVAAGAAGVFDKPKTGPRIRNIELVEPMQADVRYAFSIGLSYVGPADEWNFEVWGTTAACGAGTTADKIYELVVEKGEHVACVQLVPSTAYSHLLLVYRDRDDESGGYSSFDYEGATFCGSEGTCGG